MALLTGKVCRRNYYKNAKDSRGQLNAIPITAIEGTESFQITFYKPFQLIALATANPLPPFGGYASSWITLMNLLVQNTYSYMLQNMFISFMYANRDYDPDVTTGSTLYVPGSPDWRNYFMSHLSPTGQGLIEMNYNSFILPGSQAINFWIEESGLGSVSPWERLQRFAQFQFKHSDLALWGAPGTYIMDTALIPPPIIFEPVTQEGSLDSNTFTAISFFLIPSEFIPEENVPPFPLDNSNMDSFFWIVNSVSGNTIFGSSVVPYAIRQPDFSGGIDPATALMNWIKDILEIDAGMAFNPGDVFTQPLGDFSPGFGIGVNLVPEAQQYTMQVVIGADSTPLPENGNNFVHVRFEVPGASAPYNELLLQFVDDFGIPPVILVNEYKPVE